MVNLARDPDGKKIMNTDLLQEGTTRETDDVTELKKQLSETKRMLQEARQVTSILSECTLSIHMRIDLPVIIVKCVCACCMCVFCVLKKV